MAKIGYARVSTRDQNPNAQATRLRAEGCERVYVDHGASGKLASRPEWDKCYEHLRAGDVLVCTKLDRLGRSLLNLVTIADQLRERGVGLKVLDTPELDTTTRNGRLVFSILSALAEWEREIISERTTEGLGEARERHGGKLPGRKPSLSVEKIALAKVLKAEGKYSANQIAELIGCSRATLYRHLSA
jgi:DNA invertase Pin-like site-specific DNA recombinase